MAEDNNKKKKNNSSIYDLELLKMAGINPASILPIRRIGGTDSSPDTNKLKQILAIIDRQDATTRYVWYNLPKGLTGELIEHILYNRGQGALVKLKDTFYFLPYTLRAEKDTGNDCYSRYKAITLVTMGSVNGEKERKAFGGKSFEAIYEVQPKMNPKEENKAVLLRDYMNFIGGTSIVPRMILNDVLLDMEARLFPYAETAIISKTGVKGLRGENSEIATDVEGLNNSIKFGALHQKKFVGIVGNIDYQELGTGNDSGNVTEFLEYFQSLENFRKSTHGIATGGLMQKSSHMLEGEADMNQSQNISQGNDGLLQRQLFCVIAYSIWGIPMWCDIKQTANPKMNQTALITDNGGEQDANISE